MYIIDDIWILITEFLFHNIKKQGKHLKNDKYIVHYNSVLTTLPKLYIPVTGPRIMYNSCMNNFRIVRFLYHFKHKPWRRSKTIVETVPHNYYYGVNDEINNSIIKEDYYKNNNLILLILT
jgi:hypothetical protein